MQKHCDLELRLFPTSSYDSEAGSFGKPQEAKEEESERRMITIFYNGKMCVSSDVTDVQAKTIISMASREMEERSSSSSDGSDPPNKSTRVLHQQKLPNPKASMKRSLQSFLQKRKIRIQATSPYHK
ncbi:unnamed protein product [Arabis nemorensis]|uniref:Protein TIFY n=1 Tax=Arabis nemorensis TaxID=586526 RepID=A0A565AVC7_9BRAS|nr:unnamed protein product [Arabis nemorensis]